MNAYERLDEDLANWAVWIGRWVLLAAVLVFIGLTLRAER